MDFWEYAKQAQIPGMVKPPEVQALINHHLVPAIKSGAELIADERLRQKEVEGYNERDAEYTDGQLINAALAYAFLAKGLPRKAVFEWPWPVQHFRPDDSPVRALAKAGALLAAEIDRIQATK